MTNKKKIRSGTSLSLVVIILLSTTCRPPEEDAQKDLRISVLLAPVEQRELAEPLHTFGRLSSPREIKLSFKIGGVIEQILVSEGQRVEKDQVLARLNLSEIESQVQQARSIFDKAQRDFKRVDNLYLEKAATLEQHQNVQTALQVAQAQLETAEFNLRYAVIRAPSNGKILKKLMEENEMTGPGMPLFFFASTDMDWIVRVGVSDRDLVRIRINDPSTIRFDPYPDTIFEGLVAEIVEAADPWTGTFEVEVSIDAQGKRLVSGFVAEVDIFPSSKTSYSVIPVDALVEADKNRGFVYTVDEETKTARRIPVIIGFLFGESVAVESGLEKIEKVVAVGAPYLTDGTEVRILKEQSPTSKSDSP